MPAYEQIEANLNNDGNVVLKIVTSAYVGATKVQIVTVFPTLAPPEDWDGTKWETDVADQIETDYIDSGYTYPA
jgi:hypothetical protein